MKKVFFTPGPSQLYPTVPAHLQTAWQDGWLSLSHRSEAFHGLYREATAAVRSLFDLPAGHEVFFLASATEAMARIVENCLARKSWHLVNGAFSERFWAAAWAAGKTAEKTEVTWGCGFDLATAVVPADAEMMCLTQTETSTGVSLPPASIEALARTYPDKLLAVDLVSSAPLVALDFRLIDCAFFSVQKGFGLPAGLGVLIVSPRAMERAATLARRRPEAGYHDFVTLKKYAAREETPETPNVLAIYLLSRVGADMERRGIEVIRREISRRARIIYDALKAGPGLRPGVAEPAYRSPTVCVADVLRPGGAGEMTGRLAADGLIIGRGYGKKRDRQVRIANFPALWPEDVAELAVKLGRQ